MTGIEGVLDPWLESVGDRSKRAATVNKIVWVSEHYGELLAQQAPVGDHPLIRWLHIPEEGVTHTSKPRRSPSGDL